MTNMIDEIGNDQSMHCYPKTDILINKKNIRNLEELENEEKILTAYKLAILNSGDYSALDVELDEDNHFDKIHSFDSKHYLSIHKFLFEELYDFAGKFRDEDTSKSEFFCLAKYASINLKKYLDDMKKNICFVDSRDRLILFLAKYFTHLNSIHPFREGNGRTLREYLREYVEYINEVNGFNYELDYSLMTDDIKAKYFKGSIDDDYKIMMEVFDSLIIEKELKNEKGIYK